MANIRYELNEKLKTGLYGFSGTFGGNTYIQKPWTEFTQKQLKEYAESANEKSLKEHLVIVEVKEVAKDGKATKQKSKEETTTNEQEGKDASK